MNESLYPVQAQNQLKELRDARAKFNEISNSLNISSDDILNFDVKTATVINDKNEVVNNPQTMQRSTQSYAIEKTKQAIEKNKWWLIGGVTLLLLSVISYFTFFRKGGK
jgi:hypothetical protein